MLEYACEDHCENEKTWTFGDDEPIDESADAEIESELRVTEAIDRKTPIRPKRLKSY